MNRKNLYYAQLGEALKFAQYEIFEYKRIGLILFDNIIENLLTAQCEIGIRHKFIMSEISKNEYDRRLSSLRYFDGILNQSISCELINIEDKHIIDYCHKVRNKLNHSLFADRRITDFCVIYCIHFLEMNFKSLVEIGITSYSKCDEESTLNILNVCKVNDFKEIISELVNLKEKNENIAQEILASIVEDYMCQIDEALADEVFETYDQLSKVTNEYFSEYFKNHIYVGLNSNSRSNQNHKLSEQTFRKIKMKNVKIKSSSIYDSFKSFQEIICKIEPICLGLMLYNSLQECSDN